jgi:hypothetical protein
MASFFRNGEDVRRAFVPVIIQGWFPSLQADLGRQARIRGVLTPTMMPFSPGRSGNQGGRDQSTRRRLKPEPDTATRPPWNFRGNSRLLPFLLNLSHSLPERLAHAANLTPSGISPVSTKRQRATSSLRARATIMIFLIRPLAPLTRWWNHLARPLSG